MCNNHNNNKDGKKVENERKLFRDPAKNNIKQSLKAEVSGLRSE